MPRSLLIVADAGDSTVVCPLCWDDQPYGRVVGRLPLTDAPYTGVLTERADFCEWCGDTNIVPATLPDGTVAFASGSGCVCGMADPDPDYPFLDGGDCRSIGCNPLCPDCGPDDDLASADEVEDAGLDPTGRDGNPRFPYRRSDLPPHAALDLDGDLLYAIGCPLCESAWDCSDCIAAHLALAHGTTYDAATHPVYAHPYTPSFCDPAGCKGR